MAVGSVKWFNPQKGFGFIQPENGGADIFVHISAVERAGLITLNDGQSFSFDLEAGRQGKRRPLISKFDRSLIELVDDRRLLAARPVASKGPGHSLMDTCNSACR